MTFYSVYLALLNNDMMFTYVDDGHVVDDSMDEKV